MKYKKIDSLPLNLFEKSIENWEVNNLVSYLRTVFGIKDTEEVCRRYHIGSTIHWQHGTAFWQIDSRQRIRHAKFVLFNAFTGKIMQPGSYVQRWDWRSQKFKREKAVIPCEKLYGKMLARGSNLHQCFFGEDQINEFPEKKIGIVESEKSAVILSILHPDYVWLATGGNKGVDWTNELACRVLFRREVFLFPNKGCYQFWLGKSYKLRRLIHRDVRIFDEGNLYYCNTF